MSKSKGHVGYAGRFEYFMVDEQLYRAPTTNPLSVDGYRQGARWQAPKHMADEWFDMMVKAQEEMSDAK